MMNHRRRRIVKKQRTREVRRSRIGHKRLEGCHDWAMVYVRYVDFIVIMRLIGASVVELQEAIGAVPLLATCQGDTT